MSLHNYSCSFDNFEFEVFSDFLPKDEPEDIYPDLSFGESIHSDIKYLESNFLTPSAEHFEIICNDNDSEKYEIRNHDCMWSGRCKTDYDKNKLAAKGQQQQQQNIISSTKLTTVESIKQTTAVPPATIQTVAPQFLQSKSAIQNIPPGTSLLLNSRLNNNSQKKQSQQHHHNKLTIPTVMPSDFLKDREQMNQMRPDSPLSLDDDPPEFKHSVDLTACIMGSNNISLDTSSLSLSLSSLSQHMINGNNNDIEKVLRIKMLREQLEDTSGKMMFNDSVKTMGCSSGIGGGPADLSDVLNVLKADFGDKSDDIDSDSGESMISSNEEAYHSKSHSPSSGYGSNSPEYNSPVMHSDHSYTRSKSGVDPMVLGLETPSDSDEEIDVVSVGDKKLPTNPSDKDRRALQTKVANKITARIVKTPGGIKTIPPRRRCSMESYGSTTLSPAKSPLSSSYYNSLSSSSSSSSSSSTTSKFTNPGSRKRHYISSNKDDYSPSNKRSRGKKQRSPSHKRHINNTVSSNISVANNSNNNNLMDSSFDPDDADTIEKRNLHNDMERQRRIGLKNLFEALKRQIPSIKDKERAPKVNILREAAKLCEQFTSEEKKMTAMKQQLQLQMQRRQAQLRSIKVQAMQRAGGKSIA